MYKGVVKIVSENRFDSITWRRICFRHQRLVVRHDSLTHSCAKWVITLGFIDKWMVLWGVPVWHGMCKRDYKVHAPPCNLAMVLHNSFQHCVAHQMRIIFIHFQRCLHLLVTAQWSLLSHKGVLNTLIVVADCKARHLLGFWEWRSHFPTPRWTFASNAMSNVTAWKG